MQVVSSAEAFDGLAGDVGDQLVVLADMQDCELREFGYGGDEQIGNGGGAVVASVGEDRLHLDGPVLDGRGEVLHGKRRRSSSGAALPRGWWPTRSSR